MFLAYFAGISLTLSSFTQLRVNGIGPGELMIVLSIFGALGTIFVRNRIIKPRRLLIYIAVALSASVLGLITVAFKAPDAPSFPTWGRQYFAINLAIVFPILISISVGHERLKHTLKFFSISTILIYGLTYLFVIMKVEKIFTVPLMYGEDRFIGLSENPNQTAFAIGIAVVFLTHSLLVGEISKKFGIPLILLGAITGLATSSNALQVTLALTMSMALLGNQSVRQNLEKQRFFKILKSLRIMFGFSAVLGGLLWIFFNSEDIYAGKGAGASEGEGAVRLGLWYNAIQAWSSAPFLGHGPGHFSGFSGPFEEVEAHNTILDWLTSYGAIGALCLMLLIFSTAFQLIRQKQYSMGSLLISIIMFSSFHFLGRIPLFWLCLFYCYQMTAKKSVFGEKKT